MTVDQRADILHSLEETGRWRGELLHSRRDGTPIVVDANSITLRDPGGQSMSHVTVFHDITERKRMEVELSETASELRASRDQLAQREISLQALSRRLVEVQERERSYVADQLYNEAGQVIAALKVQLALLGRQIQGGGAPGQDLAEMQQTLDRVMREFHELAGELRPASLDHLGLAPALNQRLLQFGKEHDLQITFEALGQESLRVPPQAETAVYRIVQEALLNVAHHARAGRVDLTISRGRGTLVISVADDGMGFDLKAALARGALGLMGMRERAAALGGQVTIETAPGAGTTVVVEVPIA